MRSRLVRSRLVRSRLVRSRLVRSGLVRGCVLLACPAAGLRGDDPPASEVVGGGCQHRRMAHEEMLAGMTPTQAEGAELDEPHLGVAGLIRRARRVADLSQRDLAMLLGVSPAAVAHWETGRRLPALRQFEAIARVAGLRLMVVIAEGVQALGGTYAASGDAPGRRRGSPPVTAATDAATDAETETDAETKTVPETETAAAPETDGAPATARPSVPVDGYGGVLPMRDDGVRDRGGRRYPAHLDPAPLYQVWRPRWDRPELNLLCHRRRRRDAERSGAGSGLLDHTSALEVAATLADWQAERQETLRLRLQSRTPHPAASPATDAGSCTCSPECHESGPCLDGCPCGCEPDPYSPT
nr:helix-turn-helix transcriptional regulator [Propionibacterium sp.]